LGYLQVFFFKDPYCMNCDYQRARWVWIRTYDKTILYNANILTIYCLEEKRISVLCKLNYTTKVEN
jgi:hypothetical protein